MVDTPHRETPGHATRPNLVLLIVVVGLSVAAYTGTGLRSAFWSSMAFLVMAGLLSACRLPPYGARDDRFEVTTPSG